MDELRLEWERQEDGIHFYSKLRGGTWTARRKGTVADSTSMFARSHVEPWCHVYSWPRQRGFMHSKYGVDDATFLAEEWARRSEYFYVRWLENGASNDYTFTQEDVALYAEPLEWVTWASEVDPESETFDRIMELRRAVPMLPRPI